MSRYSRWQDAMIAQTRIAEWYQTEQGIRYLMGFMDDMNKKHDSAARLDPRMLASIAARAVIDAEPCYVGIDACELVDHARETFEPEAVMPSDPFVPGGFCLLAKPLVIADAPVTETSPWRSPSGLIPIRAISWMSIHSEDLETGAFWIQFYTLVDDEMAIYGPEGKDSRYVEDPSYYEYMRRYCPLSLVHQWQWSWYRNPAVMREDLDIVADDDPEAAPIRARQQAQLIQTLWRIGSQFTPARQMPERQIRRDARRNNVTHHDEVNLVVLRRTSPTSREEPSGRQLTVQFPVNGYWATRHMRDEATGKLVPRQRWVKSHMKGPVDAPLVIKDRVWEFRR
jgi:hypothetical protein